MLTAFVAARPLDLSSLTLKHPRILRLQLLHLRLVVDDDVRQRGMLGGEVLLILVHDLEMIEHDQVSDYWPAGASRRADGGEVGAGDAELRGVSDEKR